MNQTLLFRFIAADRVEWLAHDTRLRQGSLAELAAQTQGGQLVLVAPSEVITLALVKVPGRNRAARLKAVPYALEDNLADEVGNLHFAIGGAVSDTELPVAVLRHETLAVWLAACAQAQITPTAIVPDVLLLPLEADAWSILLENERAVVRTGPWEGFAIEREHLASLLGLALIEAGDHRPQYLRAWGGALPELASLDLDVRSENGALAPLQVFTGGCDLSGTVNLLQGPYSRTAHLGKWLRPWRSAAILAGLWLGAQAVLQITEYRQLSQEQKFLRQALEHVYRDAVPTARKIVNPRAQLENRLQELRRGTDTGQEAFFGLLYQGAGTLMDFRDVTIRGLRYGSNTLDLDLEGGSLETLDRLKQRLTEQPDLSAEVRTTKREGKVESQISLRRTPL